jgi:hypothetical protein
MIIENCFKLFALDADTRSGYRTPSLNGIPPSQSGSRRRKAMASKSLWKWAFLVALTAGSGCCRWCERNCCYNNNNGQSNNCYCPPQNNCCCPPQCCNPCCTTTSNSNQNWARQAPPPANCCN